MAPALILGLITLALGSYLYGSLCWAIIISRWKLRKDIRLLGDGNPGAYNTGRQLGGKYFITVMFLDTTKGLIPAIFATTINFKELQGWAIGLAGCFSVLGHCYPLYFRFKGGNGFSTIFGFMIIYHPLMVLTWGIFVFLLTLMFKFIRPMQLLSMVLTGSLGAFIKWPFYWWNVTTLLTLELSMETIPIMVLTVAFIQLPRFVPYIYGMYNGTEEKMYFFAPLFRKHKDTTDQL